MALTHTKKSHTKFIFWGRLSGWTIQVGAENSDLITIYHCSAAVRLSSDNIIHTKSEHKPLSGAKMDQISKWGDGSLS